MANDFDQFPLNDNVIKYGTTQLSDVWRDSLATFFQNLISYLTQGGILLPSLTTEQRNQIQNPQEGQIIYLNDATIGPPRSAEIQVWQVKLGVGAWRTITTTP